MVRLAEQSMHPSLNSSALNATVGSCSAPAVTLIRRGCKQSQREFSFIARAIFSHHRSCGIPGGGEGNFFEERKAFSGVLSNFFER